MRLIDRVWYLIKHNLLGNVIKTQNVCFTASRVRDSFKHYEMNEGQGDSE